MRSIEKIQAKILDRESLEDILSKEKKNGKRVVFTNGCFDILHRGHMEYLADASDLADLFVIGLNSDASVRKLKGESRPAVDEDSRSIKLASFEFVDYLVIFDEDTPTELMQ